MRIYVSIRGTFTALICFLVDSLDGSSCFDCIGEDCTDTCEGDACFYMQDIGDLFDLSLDQTDAFVRRHIRDVSLRNNHRLLDTASFRNRMARDTKGDEKTAAKTRIKGCVDFMEKSTSQKVTPESGFLCSQSKIGHRGNIICVCFGEKCNGEYPLDLPPGNVVCKLGNQTNASTCRGNACLRLQRNQTVEYGCISHAVGKLKDGKPEFGGSKLSNFEVLEDLFDPKGHCLDFGAQKQLCTCFSHRCNQVNHNLDLDNEQHYDVQCNTSTKNRYCRGNACGIDISMDPQGDHERYCYQLIDPQVNSEQVKTSRRRFTTSNSASPFMLDTIKCKEDFCNANSLTAQFAWQRETDMDWNGGDSKNKRSLVAMVFGYIGLFFVVLMFLWIMYICCSYQFQLCCVKHNSGSVWRKKSSYKKREQEVREKEEKERKAFLDRQKRHAQSLKVHGSESVGRPRLMRAYSEGGSVLSEKEREKYERLLAKLEAKDREKADAAQKQREKTVASEQSRLSRIEEHEHWDDEGSTVILGETPVFSVNGHARSSRDDVFTDDASSTATLGSDARMTSSPPPPINNVPKSSLRNKNRVTLANDAKNSAARPRVNIGQAVPREVEGPLLTGGQPGYVTTRTQSAPACEDDPQFDPLTDQEIQKINRLLSRASWNRSLKNPRVNLALVADEL